MKVDIVIIGGGPIGLACGIEAQKKGYSYVILEKGCLVNSIYHYPTHMTFFSTSDRLEIGDVPFMSIQPKPTRLEALEYYRRVVQHWQLHLRLFEEVQSIQIGEPFHQIFTNKAQYEARHIILATGFYDIPIPLNVPGEDLPKVTHYYQDPHFYAFQKVAIVGANNSAVDAALETWRKGAEVTMIIRGDSIGERVKYWAKPDIENRIKEGSIRAYFTSQIQEISPTHLHIQTPSGLISLENDWVIALTGYQPNLDFLSRLGIRLAVDEVRKPEIVEETLETTQPRVYLAGVICGGMNTHRLFIENSRGHAPQILARIQAYGPPISIS